jgi:hypothetical protein
VMPWRLNVRAAKPSPAAEALSSACVSPTDSVMRIVNSPADTAWESGATKNKVLETLKKAGARPAAWRETDSGR